LTIVWVFVGWIFFWFLTDDALIAFRYASNSLAGLGYVWNPPPFRPVEGYTSFLWVFLMRHIWYHTGLPPTVTANWVSLCFGYLTLWLGTLMVLRMRMPTAKGHLRLTMVALVLLGTVLNRSFLIWLSSGLETALFNFTVTWWVYAALAPREKQGAGFIFHLSISAALAALTRPDGLLLAAGTACIGLYLLIQRSGKLSLTQWAASSPLLLIPAHLLWRHSFYGEWVPNTYYAKYTAPWPESGLRYLAGFVIENGSWFWLFLVMAVGIRALFSRRVSRSTMIFDHFPTSIVLAVLSGHLAYYSLMIGGDYFEYRVLSHLVLLLFVSGAWLSIRAFGSRGPVLASATMTVFVLVSLPISWTLTYNSFVYGKEPFFGVRSAPAILRPGIEFWNGLQSWFFAHSICVRQERHRDLYLRNREYFPPRAVGSTLKWKTRGVYSRGTIGMPGWVFPEVAMIDRYGLNDRVIARNLMKDNRGRRLFHERGPPPGYIECFRPNLRFTKTSVSVVGRPLSDERIIECESRDWFSIGN
jgi:arabinofuranosyltransferase